MNKNINTNGRAALYASIYPAIERTCVANVFVIDDGTIGIEHLKKGIV